jgi:N-acetylglucosaminyldiphosphoundecaprenol N-acetyl-beta-D-mannosaminyltransferase
MKTVNILGIPIAAVSMNQAADQIEEWILHGQQAYVTVTGVHGIMESQYDDAIRKIHQDAGMCVPDGMPTVWIGKAYGHKNMTRVYGPDLMLEMIKRSFLKGYTHFFFGGKDGVPELLRERLEQNLSGLNVLGVFSPPFSPMREKEEEDFKDLIGSLSPDILWVGLSTPKQEKWMAAHLGKLDTRVMIGVGAAFDFHAGLLRQAPYWMQRSSLEWLFRLWVEPRRLWRRYLKNNPLFIWMMLQQFLGFNNYQQIEQSKEKGYLS